MDTIDSVLATADRSWRRYGVGPADRAALAADLRLDLEAAASDGAGPGQLLGPDVPGFARRLADEAGVRREPPALGHLLGTALVGGALGATLGAAWIYGLLSTFWRLVDDPPRIDVPVQVAVGAYYGIPAAMVVAGAVIAVRLQLRDLPRIRQTCRAMILLLPVAGLAITPVTMAFAWTTGYSDAPFVVLAETGLVLGALTGATVLARRWALRERRRVAGPAPTPAR